MITIRTWLLGVVLLLGTAFGIASLAFGTTARTQELPTTSVPVGSGGSYTDVSAAGLAAMLHSKGFPLINVHVPYEGEIEGTDLFIPFDQIEAHLDQLPTDRGARLVLYCRSGSMSAIAARTLVGLGYQNVWNLDGGTIGWEQAGYPLVFLAR